MEEYLTLLQQGERPNRQAFLARHVEIADILSDCLHGLELVQAAGPELSHPALSTRLPREENGIEDAVAPAQHLGDFQIVRELGRGGMGVVYEAVQISLGRRVALKVLPFAAALDARQLQRFKHEAQAAALLHQPHIVPVFGVGEARGVHYYAMQYIEGQDLACLIRRLRQQARKVPAVANPETGRDVPSSDLPVAPNSPSVETAVAVVAGASTVGSWPSISYVRAVARLGIQAAEALEHAHQLGVIHRDIKPANLLLDLRDNLWITDFGLAQLRGQTGLTVTGDLVGTLRYMSPEQALANRVVIDQRSDIYSLGVTLYELLTLEPAFAGENRQELLRQIAFEEPQKIRAKTKSVPAELETIIFKACAKNPTDRYATAQELADDLSRFLEHRPIRARRPTLRQRALWWARRNPAATWSATTAVVVIGTMLAGGLGYVVRDRAAREGQISSAVGSALDEADKWEQVRKWPESLAAAERARVLLGNAGGDPALRANVVQRRDNLAMALRLQDIRLEMAAVKNETFDLGLGDTLYATAFREYGIDLEALEPEEVARRLPAGAVRDEMVAAVDDWARIRRERRPSDANTWKRLSLAARAADPDTWRGRVREVLVRAGEALREDLKALAASAPHDYQHPSDSILVMQVCDLREIKPIERNDQRLEIVAILREAQQRHPGDFWLNHNLANRLFFMQPPQFEEALSFYRAALALRPDSAGVLLNLGNALSDLNRLDEAIAADERAIHLDPNYAAAHNNLGGALFKKGLLDKAAAAYLDAIRLKSGNSNYHYNLGVVLFNKGNFDEAITAYREAARLAPNDFKVRHYLGVALGARGLTDEAVRSCSLATRINPKDAASYNGLGSVLCDKKRDYDGAITAFRRAIELAPTEASYRHNLSRALTGKGAHNEAIETLRLAMRLFPDDANARDLFGDALVRKGELDKAIRVFRETIQQHPKRAQSLNNLGLAFSAKGALDDAIAAYQKSINLDANAFEAHMNLCIAFMHKKTWDNAIAAANEAIRCKPDLAEAHCNLGQALREKGQLQEALRELRRGHELGAKDPNWAFPSAKWVADCERLLEKSDPRLVRPHPDKVPSPAASIAKTPIKLEKNLGRSTPAKGWVRGLGGPGHDFVHGITVDGAGNTYVTGAFDATAKFGSIQLTGASASPGSSYAYLAKLDADGQVLWAVTPGGSAGNRGRAVAVDPGGDIYVAGHHREHQTLGGNHSRAAGGVDSFLAKFRGSDGQCLWARQLGGKGHDWLINLAVDAQGNVFVGGDSTLKALS